MSIKLMYSEGGAGSASKTLEINPNFELTPEQIKRMQKGRRGKNWCPFKKWNQFDTDGPPRSVNGFYRLLERCNVKLGPFVEDIIPKIDFDEEFDLKEFTVVAPSFGELLVPKAPLGYSSAWQLMRNLYMLQPYTLLMAVKLRFAYLNQPGGEEMLVGTEPILHPDIGPVLIGLNSTYGKACIDLYPAGLNAQDKSGLLKTKITKETRLTMIYPDM